MKDAEIDFFLRSKSFFCTSESGESELIDWGFVELDVVDLPMRLFRCEINGFGISSLGMGMDWDRRIAARRAFSEAWERLWLSILKKNGTAHYETSSNGFAADWLEANARAAARSELIERHVMLKAWREKCGWKKSIPKSPSTWVLITALRMKGWRTDIFNIRSSLGIVRACLLRNQEKGAVFDSIFRPISRIADERLLFSCMRGAYALVSPIKDIKEDDVPESHFLFYRSPRNLPAFEFLDKSLDNEQVQIEQVEKIECETVFKGGNFPSVARAQNPFWPDLCWGTKSITGINKWPHPLA